jgi:flagellar biosynthesis protein FliR
MANDRVFRISRIVKLICVFNPFFGSRRIPNLFSFTTALAIASSSYRFKPSDLLKSSTVQLAPGSCKEVLMQ